MTDVLYLTRRSFASVWQRQLMTAFLFMPLLAYFGTLRRIQLNWARLHAALWFNDAGAADNLALIGKSAEAEVYKSVSPRIIMQRGGALARKPTELVGAVAWAVAAPVLVPVGHAMFACTERLAANAAMPVRSAAARRTLQASLAFLRVVGELWLAVSLITASSVLVAGLAGYVVLLGPLLWRADVLSIPAAAQRFFYWDQALDGNKCLSPGDLSFLFSVRLLALALLQSVPMLALQIVNEQGLTAVSAQQNVSLLFIASIACSSATIAAVLAHWLTSMYRFWMRPGDEPHQFDEVHAGSVTVSLSCSCDVRMELWDRVFEDASHLDASTGARRSLSFSRSFGWGSQAVSSTSNELRSLSLISVGGSTSRMRTVSTQTAAEPVSFVRQLTAMERKDGRPLEQSDVASGVRVRLRADTARKFKESSAELLPWGATGTIRDQRRATNPFIKWVRIWKVGGQASAHPSPLRTTGAWSSFPYPTTAVRRCSGCTRIDCWRRSKQASLGIRIWKTESCRAPALEEYLYSSTLWSDGVLMLQCTLLTSFEKRSVGFDIPLRYLYLIL